jgi:hypothetical protein
MAASTTQLMDPRNAWHHGHARARAKAIAKRVLVASLLVACRPLEAALGGLAPDGSTVIVENELTCGALEDLFRRRACAVRIPNFCPREVADSLSSWMMASGTHENWKVRNRTGEFTPTDTFYSAGTPFNVALKGEATFLRYFEDALPAVRRQRTATRDLTPIDRLRLELDEVWPFGAHIASYKGLKMSVGIGRVMTPGGMLDGIAKTEGMCHVDGFSFRNQDSGFFSANVYLRVPDSGGELTIWNVGTTPTTAACNLSLLKMLLDFDAKSQEYIRSKLPPPLVVRPEPGDLIIIDSTRPHSVRGFAQGVRVTLQSFIRYKAGQPLALWV